jgi:hypothetical protein
MRFHTTARTGMGLAALMLESHESVPHRTGRWRAAWKDETATMAQV